MKIASVNQPVMHPPFSVLMSVYKNEKPEHLKQALDSVFQNTIPPDEVVMVKDGPLPDSLEKVLNTYQAVTGRLHFVIHEKNMGLGLALRDGLPKCSYELVARMDTDDVCTPDRFEKELVFMENNPDIAVVGGWVDEFTDDFRAPYSLIIVPEKYEEIRVFAKKRNPLKHPTVMFKKSAVLSSGNYRHFLWFEDYDLCIRMLKAGYKMANIPKVLLHVRADKGLYNRRGGMSYLKREIKFQQFMRNTGFINQREFLVNCASRAVVRLMPNKARAWVYGIFLRRKL